MFMTKLITVKLISCYIVYEEQLELIIIGKLYKLFDSTA